MRRCGPLADEARLVETWRELLDRHARTTSALERSLHEHGLGVSEYEVLERLATGEKDEHRMQDLAEAVHLSQSALSRVVARLEADGLVVRAMCAEDRRGIFACLTDAGRERYAAARPAHRAVLAEALGGLTDPCRPGPGGMTTISWDAREKSPQFGQHQARIVKHIAVGVAAELVAPGTRLALPAAILLPSVARAVVLVAVELDGDAQLGPAAIDATAAGGPARLG